MCFSVEFLESLCIWLVCVIALVAIIRLLVPLILSWVALPAVVVQIINILLWVAVAVLVIRLIFPLIECLFNGAGMPHIGRY